MNKQMKNLLLAGMTILLFSACTPAETPEVSEVIPENPTNAPESTVASDSAEEAAGTALADDSGAGEFSKYIGLTYPPLPVGLTEGFGMLIQNSDGYGLSLVIDGANKMLWLGKIISYAENGGANWEVKDVLGLSNLEAGLTLIPDGCLLNGVPESEIFVAGRNGVTVLAWRANTTSGRFEAISTNGIECHSDKGVSLD